MYLSMTDAEQIFFSRTPQRKNAVRQGIDQLAIHVNLLSKKDGALKMAGEAATGMTR